MKVIVFGGSGKTGSLVVRKALASGHAVTVFVHGEGAFDAAVRVVTGDSSDAQAIRRAVADQDAVIDTIGGRTPYKHTDLETSAARNIIEGMKGGTAKRLVVISALGVGDSIEQTPFWYEYLLIPTYLRGSTQDKSDMEAAVKAGEIEYVIARPPMLTDDPETGSTRIITGQEKALKITRGDLARFLVDQLVSDEHLGKSVVVANE